MSKGYRAVVRIPSFDKYVTVEPAHFLNSKYADTAEASGRHGKYLALRNISAKFSVRSALETEKRDIRRSDISLKSTPCNVGFLIRFETAVHDKLVLHCAA